MHDQFKTFYQIYQHKHTANFQSHLNPLHHSSGNWEHLLQIPQSLSFCSMTQACLSRHVLSEFCEQLTLRLQLTLKGIQHSQALSHSSKPCLPITLQLLQNIYTYLSHQPHCYNNILMWAACCPAFFDFSGWVNFPLLQISSTTRIATYVLMILP